MAASVALVVVTALLGGMDSLNSHEEDREELQRFERRIGLSCWFAFVDEAVAKNTSRASGKTQRAHHSTIPIAVVQYATSAEPWSCQRKKWFHFVTQKLPKIRAYPDANHRVFRAANFMPMSMQSFA